MFAAALASLPALAPLDSIAVVCEKQVRPDRIDARVLDEVPNAPGRGTGHDPRRGGIRVPRFAEAADAVMGGRLGELSMSAVVAELIRGDAEVRAAVDDSYTSFGTPEELDAKAVANR